MSRSGELVEVISPIRDQAIETAATWLLESGIQVPGGPDAGAFRSWDDPQRPGFPYSEVTGYAIQTLCLLDRERPGGPYLARARAAVNWLLTQAHAGRAFRCRRLGAEFEPVLCVFDNAMIVRGLCAFAERTGDPDVAAVACDTASWILDEMLDPVSHRLWPRWSLLARSVVPEGERWSARAGPYQAKVALAFLAVNRLRPDQRFAAAARLLCEAAIADQRPDGRFVSDPDGTTYLHAHLYAVEGIAGVAEALALEGFRTAALRGLRWAVRQVAPARGLPAWVGGSRAPVTPAEEHSDSTAQLLRLLSWLGSEPALAERLAVRLSEFQCVEADPRRRGGFRYARRRDAFDRNLTTHGSLFAIQALKWQAAGARHAGWQDLV